jgi:Pyruvate phosphate dikinase, AMP/ATP-binding domain/Secretion system C-terminal sorting domain
MKKSLIFLLKLLICTSLQAQQIPIISLTSDQNGQVQIKIASTSDHYYVLHVRHDPTGNYEQITSITLGENGTTILTEPLAAYPIEHYKVTQHLITEPIDSDLDGIDDLTELSDMPTKSPLNTAPAIDFINGVSCIPDRLTFKTLSYQEPQGTQNPTFSNLEFVKFFITDRDSDEPKLYFINNNTHTLHTEFANSVGLTNNGTLMTGTIVFHPNVVAPNGTLGTYRLVFQPNNAFTFEYVQKAMELLAANLPFLKNNLCYYPLELVGLPLYWQEKTKYDASRICVLLEDDLFADVDYLALNVAEGYGLLRVMNDHETPNSRDVVLYEALPNEMPRVGGIITTVMQTPLSHVNLRAIQDHVPNAFIRDALQQSGIDSLIGKYVYYKAEQANYTLREATLQEVNVFFDSIRPSQEQHPIRDLSKSKILPLDSIFFQNSTSFGAKCANVATMRRFGFPDETIPNGFGIPFYFYDEFMIYNGFYAQAQNMINNATFLTNFDVRIQMLADFRHEIEEAHMPSWMIAALSDMQQSFASGMSLRCRSSTNNEDLPGFSGAGLYDSRTQHPDEGHISKSIKQIYASIWNFRAFDVRDFYRINHFEAAMGILVHPAFEGEKANGVGVSTDPIYQTEGTFYLNTQVGEDLVTNPTALSIPEEIILDAISVTEDDYFVMNPSNQVPMDSLILKEVYLDQMRDYLTIIHNEFEVLYNAVGKPGFAMEMEYKISAENQLTIKQARPWVAYWVGNSQIKEWKDEEIGLNAYPNPFGDVLRLECNCETELMIEMYNLLGQNVLRKRLDFRNGQKEISLTHLGAGGYFLRGIDKTGKVYFSKKLMKTH